MKYKKLLLIVPLFSLLISCNNNKEDDSSDQKVYNYILEDDETYNTPEIMVKELSSFASSSITIDGISNLRVDPYKQYILYDDITIYYPTASLLEGENVLYTSNWYERNTFKRNDDVIEYSLLKDEDNSWYVANISSKSETFIPFNGLVLSVPKEDASYNLYDTIDINGTIPTYQLGLYNKQGKRLAVNYANDLTFYSDGIMLYDSNYSGLVTESRSYPVISANFVYDSDKKQYQINKFRRLEDNGKIHTNINDGFMLAASGKSSNANASLIEGVRFNLNDYIMIENDGLIFNQTYTLNTKGPNTYKFINYLTLKENTLEYTITKGYSESNNKWYLEVAIDNNDTICEVDYHVSIPDGGYKLTIIPTSGSAESASNLAENIFKIGNIVTIDGTIVTVDANIYDKASNLFEYVFDKYNETSLKVYQEAYSYDIDKLNEIDSLLLNTKKEINEIRNSTDSTLNYRLNCLVGNLYQILNDLEGVTSINNSSMVKACWYITDFGSYDYSLESIEEHLDILKENGFNEIMVNVIDNGRAYYDNSSVLPLNGTLESKTYGDYGHDYIKAITSLAHEKGIKVFANFCPFTSNLHYTLEEIDDDCFAKNIDGKKTVSTSQGNVTMLDPANETVITTIKKIINDIFTCNPELDGLHIDYIRYGADNNQINTCLGFNEAERVGFNKYCSENGLSYNFVSLDAMKQTLRTNSVAFNKFNEYQQNVITESVRYIKETCKQYSKPLTCAVADDYNLTKTWKCQDWATWAKEGIVDGLYLMDYYLGKYWIEHFFDEMVTLTNNNCLLICGVSTSYSILPSSYFSKAINSCLSNSASAGYSMFATHTNDIKKDSYELVSNNAWAEVSSPYDSLDVIIESFKNLLIKRCYDIYIKYGFQDESQKDSLKEELNKLKEVSLNDNKESCLDLISMLNNMKNNEYALDDANDRINEQIDYLIHILNVKANIYQ